MNKTKFNELTAREFAALIQEVRPLSPLEATINVPFFVGALSRSMYEMSPGADGKIWHRLQGELGALVLSVLQWAELHAAVITFQPMMISVGAVDKNYEELWAATHMLMVTHRLYDMNPMTSDATRVAAQRVFDCVFNLAYNFGMHSIEDCFKPVMWATLEELKNVS